MFRKRAVRSSRRALFLLSQPRRRERSCASPAVCRTSRWVCAAKYLMSAVSSAHRLVPHGCGRCLQELPLACGERDTFSCAAKRKCPKRRPPPARRPWAVGPAGACDAGRCRDGASMHRRGRGAIPRAPPADFSASAAPPRGVNGRQPVNARPWKAGPDMPSQGQMVATPPLLIVRAYTRAFALRLCTPFGAADAGGISPQGERKGCARAPHARDGDRRAPQAAANPRSGRDVGGDVSLANFLSKESGPLGRSRAEQGGVPQPLSQPDASLRRSFALHSVTAIFR